MLIVRKVIHGQTTERDASFLPKEQGSLFFYAEQEFRAQFHMPEVKVPVEKVLPDEGLDLQYPTDPKTGRTWILSDGSYRGASGSEISLVEKYNGKETVLQSFAPSYALFYYGTPEMTRSASDPEEYEKTGNFTVQAAKYRCTAKPLQSTDYALFEQLVRTGWIDPKDVADESCFPFLIETPGAYREMFLPEMSDGRQRDIAKDLRTYRKTFQSIIEAEKGPILTEEAAEEKMAEIRKALAPRPYPEEGDYVLWISREDPTDEIAVTKGSYASQEARDFHDLKKEIGTFNDREDFFPIEMKQIQLTWDPKSELLKHAANSLCAELKSQIGRPLSELPSIKEELEKVKKEFDRLPEPKPLNREMIREAAEDAVRETGADRLQSADEIHRFLGDLTDSLGEFSVQNRSYRTMLSIPREAERDLQREEEEEMDR